MPFTFTNYAALPIPESPFNTALQQALKIMQQGQGLYGNQLALQKAQAELPYAGESAKSTAAYKSAMANYLSNPYQAQRFMTPLGKTLNEQRMQELQQGANAGGNQMGQLNSAGESENPYNPYALQLQKMTTDTDTRKRNLFASNIEKTMNYIDPDDLSRYSGLTGSLKKMYEQGKSSVGESSKEFEDYTKSLNAAKFLAKQVRQFYGASITPQMDQQLMQFTNPESWVNNPKLTKELFNQFKSILGQELGTYRQALRSTSPYQSTPPNMENNSIANQLKQSQPAQEEGLAQYSSTPGQEGVVQETRNIKGKELVKINGQWFEKY